MRLFVKLVMFGVFLGGIAYIGRANALLDGRIHDIDRAVVLCLTILGIYFVATRLAFALQRALEKPGR